MCLAVPGKLVHTEQRNGRCYGRVRFGGITHEVSLDFVPEAEVGDYVLVHVGFAISCIDAAEAERTYRLLQEMSMLEDD